MNVVLLFLHNTSSQLDKESLVNTFCTNSLSRIQGEGIEDHEFSQKEGVSMIPRSSNLLKIFMKMTKFLSQRSYNQRLMHPYKKTQCIPVQQSLTSMLNYKILIGQQTRKEVIIEN